MQLQFRHLRHHQKCHRRHHLRKKQFQLNLSDTCVTTKETFYFRPGLASPQGFEKKDLSVKGKETLEKLKSRPRRRPDWSDMMKEVESGRKLRHVQCNDRSNPILKSETITNIKGQFVFESEKANVHNALLQQIQFGVKLKSTKTNDRSKPILEGLRKFRKQMTIEEQIQKSESRAQLGQMPNTEVSFC